jgi:6-pyruvoyltetrahydropterin/6-carboxytetrahydropterin synthase
MYQLSIQREFIAQHFLIGGDWGAENELHSHRYKLEVRISAPELNEHGYLLDIVDFSAHLDDIVGRYRDQTLNELPDFNGLNPSIEHFARIVCRALANHIAEPSTESVMVRIWEDDIGWASYTLKL